MERYIIKYYNKLDALISLMVDAKSPLDALKYIEDQGEICNTDVESIERHVPGRKIKKTIMISDLLALDGYKAVIKESKNALDHTSRPNIERGYFGDLRNMIKDGRIKDVEVIRLQVADGWGGGLPQICLIVENENV